MNLSKLSNLQQRIVAGLTGAAILVGGILFSEWTFFTIFLMICCLSLVEFYNLLARSGTPVNRDFGIVAGAIIFTLIFLMESGQVSFLYFYFIFPFLFLLFIIELFRKQEKPFTTIGFTFLGIFYIAIPYGLISVSAYYLGQYNPFIVLGILLMLWGNDIGGYVAGMTMGKHKLFLRVSPKKTWEGSIGGGLLSLVVAAVISTFMTDLKLHQWLTMSMIIVIFGSYGDLVESLFKRSLSIKDSGGLIPGHGGFLDRFDGLLMSSPFIAAYLKIFS
jgi:phosphatidate cytidylyltransferase